VSDLAAAVTAALTHSILPSAIARGATAVRVAAAGEDGVITLEADGSPGAVLPILGRLEALGPVRGLLYFHLLLGRMRNLEPGGDDSGSA